MSHGHKVSWVEDMRKGSWSAKGRQDLRFPEKLQQPSASRQTIPSLHMPRARWVAGCRRHHVDQMMDLCSVSMVMSEDQIGTLVSLQNLSISSKNIEQPWGGGPTEGQFSFIHSLIHLCNLARWELGRVTDWIELIFKYIYWAPPLEFAIFP